MDMNKEIKVNEGNSSQHPKGMGAFLPSTVTLCTECWSGYDTYNFIPELIHDIGSMIRRIFKK